MAEKEKDFDAFAHGEGRQVAATNFITIPVYRGFGEIAAIFDIAGGDTVICGGYVRYMCSSQARPIKAQDVDLFPKEETAFERVKAVFLELNFTVKHENNVSLTLQNPKELPWKGVPTIQIIKPVKQGAIVTLGTAQEILENFDFTVVRAALITPTEALADEDFIQDEGKRLLKLKNIHCPISSMLRCMKYSRKGYFMRPMEAMKLFVDWDTRTQEYRDSMYAFFLKSATGEKWSKEDIDNLEALLRID